MLLKLSGSLLNEQDAGKLKMKLVAAEEVKLLDVPLIAGGFIIPYFNLFGAPSKFWRLRYLEDTRKGFDALNGKKPIRYAQAKGTVNEAYLPPFTDWNKVAGNADLPLLVTEGELKAACATKLGLPTIGLGGVWCFRSSKLKMSLLPTLELFAWKGRQVFIVYDSDAVTNPLVVAAENALAKVLLQHGAIVRIVRLPAPDGGKVGLDDFLLINEPKVLRDLLVSSPEFSESAALHALNEEVVYVRDPGFIYVFKTRQRINPSSFTSHAFANYWHETLVKGKSESIQTAVSWLQWKSRSELSKVVFSPGKGKTEGGELNLWDGWPIAPKKGSVRLWKALLDHVFYGADAGARTWFEDWCAYPLQNPGKKMASCVLLWGKGHGTGKTMVGQILCRIYGPYAAEVADDELEDPRRDWAENLQFALVDDVTGSRDNPRLANKVKTMVTQKTLRINQKYIPRYTVVDCLNYLFTGNSPDTWMLEDDDRRHFVQEVLVGKLEVLLRKEIVAFMDSNDCIAALFDYFLERDISGFDPMAEAFQTQAKEDMLMLTKSDLGAWVAELKLDPQRLLKLSGDLFTAHELLAMYDPMHSGRVVTNGMARELRKAGFRPPGKSGSMLPTKFGNVRLYAVKNRDAWIASSAKKIVEHYEAARTIAPTRKGKF